MFDFEFFLGGFVFHFEYVGPAIVFVFCFIYVFCFVLFMFFFFVSFNLIKIVILI